MAKRNNENRDVLFKTGCDLGMRKKKGLEKMFGRCNLLRRNQHFLKIFILVAVMIVISAVSCWLKKKKVAETESLRDSRRLRALPPAVSKEKTYTQKIRMKARGMGEKKWRGQSDTKLVARRGEQKRKI